MTAFYGWGRLGWCDGLGGGGVGKEVGAGFSGWLHKSIIHLQSYTNIFYMFPFCSFNTLNKNFNKNLTACNSCITQIFQLQ